MHEITLNIHMHTHYSDGSGSHADIVQAALETGLDGVIVTDHNIFVNGKEGIYTQGNKKSILLVGEEIHNQDKLPQKNHLIVFGTDRELATYAHDLNRLLESIQQCGGLAFIAHPDDPEAEAVGETDITWEEWETNGITGIELWNGFSEFKENIKTKLHAYYYAFRPSEIATGPSQKTLQRWDNLLKNGKKVIAIGGSDAHALIFKLGPIRRVIFPYKWHFQTINTHILLSDPLSGNFSDDRNAILKALAKGRVFIGYDLPSPTNGFRFSANGGLGNISMGDETNNKNGVTFQIRLPKPTECHLLRNGTVVKTWTNQEVCSYVTSDPGVYRVEVYIAYKGKRRGWIFSNPIYITS